MFKLPKWNIEELTGYVPQTTFWNDFSIADQFGTDAIQDTYNRAFASWKHDAVYLTELVMVLNHKCWYHYHQKNEKFQKLYSKLYYQAHDWALDNLKDKDIEYYLRTLD